MSVELAARYPATRSEIGPSSRVHALRKLDGRTRESKFLKTEADLLASIGGPERASLPQKILIRRIAIDLLRLELIDAEMIEGRLTDHDGRIAHALRNSVHGVFIDKRDPHGRFT